MSQALAFEVRPAGDRGLLLEFEDNTAVHGMAALVRERFGDRLAEVVPGHVTLLLVCHAGSAMPDLSELATATIASSEQSSDDGTGSSEPTVITIPVRYDGEDLNAVSQTLGSDRSRVVELHSAPLYTVAFMGFAPGFPYLLGLPHELELPRLDKPRVEVPAGSVAVAAGYCGIYPGSYPGGWNLLGRTDVVLFDPGRDPPALLAPGDRVRFEPL
jgi:KipI family sensor histidine kinase inhibitor